MICILQTFKAWNNTPELESYLVEITSLIVAKKDDLLEEGYLVDKILDKTGMKGTGRWTIQEAAERNVAIPTIAAALDMRFLSARKDERVTASLVLRGLAEIPNVDRSQIIEDAKSALYAAKICSYAQGLCLIKAASDEVSILLNILKYSISINIYIYPYLCNFSSNGISI